MSYLLEIKLAKPLEAAIDDILGEVEEILDNIRKNHPARLTHHVDIDELLAEHKAIGVVWDVQHVKDQRPDLTDAQAWDVLQACQHERLNDPMLPEIRHVADKLYPRKDREVQIIAGYDPNGNWRDNLVDLVTDAMFWCESFGESFDQVLCTARMHFTAEAERPEKVG